MRYHIGAVLARAAAPFYRGAFRSALFSLVWTAACYAQEVVPGVSSASAWAIPSNEYIHKLLAERMQHNGVGVVIGVIEPAGQRIVAYGKSGASNGRLLDGDTVFQIG